MFAQPKRGEGWQDGRSGKLDSAWVTCEGSRPQIPEMAAGMYSNPGCTHFYLIYRSYILGSTTYT